MPPQQKTKPLDLTLATPEEALVYAQLLEEQLARQSPLDLATLIWPETRRWPHLELLNNYLTALAEYRLTPQGPVPPEDVQWWFSRDQITETVKAKGPAEIPEDVDSYGAYSKAGGLAPDGKPISPIVFDLAISMMPRAGKSRLTTEAFPLWCRLLDPDCLVGVGTYSDEFGEEWGGAIRDLCIAKAETHPWLPQPIGGARSPQACFSDTRGTGSTRYVGTGGGINGKSLHVLVGDDFLKNDISAQSEATRKQVNGFIDKVWIKRKTRDLRPGARFPFPISITMATRWHRLDPIGHQTEDPETGIIKPGWCVLNIPALCIDPETDPLGRAEGAAFPNAAGHTRHALELMRAEDPRTFSALYQGSPRPESGGLVSSEFKQYWSSGDRYFFRPVPGPGIPNGYGGVLQGVVAAGDDSEGGAGSAPAVISVPHNECVVFAAADTASTKRTSSDFTVVGIFAHHRQENITFVIDWFRKRITTDEYLEEIAPLLQAHGAKRIAIENVTYGQFLGQALERSRIVGVDFYPATQDKVTRAASSDLSRIIRNGRLRLPVSADYAASLITEVGDFPYGVHDDQVDVLSAAGWFLQEQIPVYRAPKERPKGRSLEDEIDAHAELAARRRSRAKARDPWSQMSRGR